MNILVRHYDAFASVPNQGNPAGVVFDADGLTDSQMISIAKAIGFNETAFIQSSHSAALTLKYFTPGHEIPLCGHATIASIIALHDAGRIDVPAEEPFSIETKAGMIPLTIRECERVIVEMQQLPAVFIEFQGDRHRLAGVLGVSETDLHSDLPVVYGTTGTWTLIVPVRGVSVIEAMNPTSDQFPEVLTQMPRSSIHPFSIETLHEDADLLGRHFSSPYSGTIEDPVTGTASAVMAAYMATYAPTFCRDRGYCLNVEQGFNVQRHGRVDVTIANRLAPFEVTISGTAVRVEDIWLSHDDAEFFVSARKGP